jgi:methylated-DNA-protein-cysteine methyltransferase-like protein
MARTKPNGRLFERIFEVVRSIPEGHVATYGQIARHVGCCSPQMVGFAMAALPFDSDVPWHRVLNYKGMVSPRADGYGDSIQQALLEAEGIRFNDKGCVDLTEVGWHFFDL